VPKQEVVEVRATGRPPEAVAGDLQNVLNERNEDGWDLTHVQPIIYNSSTTGYLLLFFAQRESTQPNQQESTQQ
jgi:hypothetical protein